MKGIATLSIIPVRKEPSDKSEIVTQILFGEAFEVTDSMGGWSQVRLLYDDYTGWVDSKQITFVNDDELAEGKVVAADLLQLVIGEESAIPIVIGSSLPFYKDKIIRIGKKNYSYEGSVVAPSIPDISSLVQNAYIFLNAPYLWGGRSPFGIDCSGFTQVVFKLSGIKLKRDAYQQAEQGTEVTSPAEAEQGDLAFFKNKEGRVTHVGIILAANNIIHSSGRVRIDKIDEKGILNVDTKSYTHNLARIRRVVSIQ